MVLHLTEVEAEQLLHCWEAWARPEQIAPAGDWRIWLVLAGRGWGKTRTGAGWVQRIAEEHGRKARIALAAPTAADVRDVMVEGESGIITKAPPWCRPKFEPSKRRLTWPNGALATTFSAEEPDRFRGPQHTHAWADELAAWMYPEAWDQLMFGLRLGDKPQAVVTTTPRPVALLRTLMESSTTHVTRGRTIDNKDNLAEAFLTQIVKRYEGTRLGRQELDGEVLDDAPGALWVRSRIDELRVRTPPDLRRIVVAVDPAVSYHPDTSAETGIVVVGISRDGHGYVLDDLSGRFPPEVWSKRVVDAYRRHEADRVVAEVNQGGDLVETILRTVDTNVPFTAVHATRGKSVRAEPIAALYEQGRVHHVGCLAALEDQMCGWSPDDDAKSPDRVDALVWALTDLLPWVTSRIELPRAFPTKFTKFGGTIGRKFHW